MVTKTIPYFNLRKIMNSGQIFMMYEPEVGRFVVFSGNKRLELCQHFENSEKGHETEIGTVDFMCSQKEFDEYWEDYFDLEDYKMSLRDLNEMFLAFKEEAKAHGYDAALYNAGYYLGILWSDRVKENGVWLADYTDETEYEGRYFLWQQGFGRIDGIDGDVDVDVFYPEEMKEVR